MKGLKIPVVQGFKFTVNPLRSKISFAKASECKSNNWVSPFQISSIHFDFEYLQDALDAE
mgnify:CR=1 FL=1